MELGQDDGSYLVEFSPQCIEALRKYGGADHETAGALTFVRLSLSVDPHLYRSPQNRPELIRITTRHYRLERRVVPSLRFYGIIYEEEKRVLIAEVTLNPDDPTIRM